jgi:membrane fusion protein, multidrug efflux system
MKLKGIINMLFVIPAIFSLFSGCSNQGEASGNGTGTGEAGRIEPVRTVGLNFIEISRRITYNANLQAFREVYLASASPGRIERVYVEAGTSVSHGQLLVEMDKTQLRQAQVQLQSIEKDYRRLDTLRRAGSVPQQQYDQMRTQYELALSNVEFLKENTELMAPFSGTVSGKYYENGEMFSGAPNTPAGKAAILSVVQTSRLKALVSVSERYYPHIHTGMPVRLSSDVYHGEIFNGSVISIYPTIDPVTRSFTIELAVPNSDEKLRPGMFARASIELDQVNAFVVPAIAVLKLQGSNERFVFLEKDGRAKRVVVETGDRFDDQVEIVSDEINPGDNLIIAGQARLLDGIEVVVQ